LSIHNLTHLAALMAGARAAIAAGELAEYRAGVTERLARGTRERAAMAGVEAVVEDATAAARTDP
ncbi:MAG: hypothetical protein M3010_03375, partial [Candidatus Dormibacteraeota bacterium]|nr:hypothetical protein [Candidatus Dormibacteraeota bacterium]